MSVIDFLDLLDQVVIFFIDDVCVDLGSCKSMSDSNVNV